MPDIVTFTLNPAVDISTSVDRVRPVHKLRCAKARRDPGGGGINVARVVKRLGADVLAVYTAGGPIGEHLRHLVEREGIRSLTIPIRGDTREDLAVVENETGEQYRFVLPGPELAEAEWRACLDALAALEGKPRYLVASGSLAPGVPNDFYGKMVAAMKGSGAKGAKIAVDTSGLPLRRALEAGIYLIKPNLREMRELAGAALDCEDDCIAAARALVNDGRAEVVALTLGHYGAMLVTRDIALRADAIPIKPVSTVGAGDSFLGAMVARLAAGHSMEDAFRYAVAAGSAALLAHGTELARHEDVERLIGAVSLRKVGHGPSTLSVRPRASGDPGFQ
jgi:6-phosphofructokinase 2